MRKTLLVTASLAGVACVSLAFFNMTQEAPPARTGLSTEGFDLNIESPARPPAQPAAAAPAPAQEAPSESLSMLRDAVAARPLARGFLPPPPAALRAPSSQPAPWAQKQPMFRDLLASPASFIVKRTHLGNPKGLQTFVKDKRRVDRYMNHPLIKTVLSNPTLLKMLIKTPGVADAFFSSPAMQDSRTVKGMIDSGFLGRLLNAPGPAALIKDDAFMNAATSDMRVIQLMARYPGLLGGR